MNIKLNEIEIPEENPFENCKLGRKKYADILTNIINSYSSGFVLGINNKWGTGKTTFVKMWIKDLKNKGHKTVYFNAWENDFEDNPLIALMGELKELTKKSTEPEFRSTLKKAAIISKHITPIIAKAIADQYVKTQGIKDAIAEITKGLSEVFESEVTEYAEKKKSIEDFKNSLSEFIANTYDGKPLVFVIDELDRCRPNYAVSILEQIKHFFSVPNVVFILSIDKNQLGNAIKGVYGSDLIDSEEYLRRFIDLEYSIPEPDAEKFYKYLIEYYKFNEFFKSSERMNYYELQNDCNNFLKIAKLLFTNQNVPLRQQEKIFALTRLALRSFGPNNFVIPQILLLLTYIKITNIELYLNIKNKKLSLLDLQEEFLKIIMPNKKEETERDLIWFEAYLVNLYHNYLESIYSRKTLYEYDSEKGSNELLINSIINKEKNSVLLNILEVITGTRNEGDLDLGYLLKRIELLENIIK